MKILLTGVSGFLGRNICEHLNQTQNVFCPRHSELDLCNSSSVKRYFEMNGPFDWIIHTAIKNGNRVQITTFSDLSENLMMFSNLLTANNNHGTLINFCSGAAFDRRFQIDKAAESTVLKQIPIDHYGLAKNLIAKEISNNTALKAINMRLFGCFGSNEPEYRLIKSTINKIKSDQAPVVIKDRLMDFFYVKDVLKVIDYALDNPATFPRDINLVYEEKVNLLSIANYVSYTMKGKQPDCLNTEVDKAYTGSGEVLASLPIELTGLWSGIKEVINDDNTCRQETTTFGSSS